MDKRVKQVKVLTESVLEPKDTMVATCARPSPRHTLLSSLFYSIIYIMNIMMYFRSLENRV